ncbi:MAG: sulfatase-like hydrolase/transferase [Leptolyngbyaceae cyanobacterium SL_7_1]|nr:sulfatase-like hydrolase/transferase [Leptolyngbyaceae cyanobacterium SL_7_1]
MLLRPPRLTELASQIELPTNPALALLASPFEAAAYTTQIRPNRGDRLRYNPASVALYLWQLQPYQIENATPRAVNALDPEPQGYCFTFNPLGLDRSPLFNLPQTEPDLTTLAQEENVPGILTAALLKTVMQTTDRAHLPVQVWVNHQLQSFEIADLSQWQSKAPLAIDPERGRLKFHAEQPPQRVTVSYVEGFSGDVGAGAYERADAISEQPPVPGQITWKVHSVEQLAAAAKTWNQYARKWQRCYDWVNLPVARVAITAEGIRVVDPPVPPPPMRPGVLRGLQPIARLGEIDLMIAPGVAIDRQGQAISVHTRHCVNISSYPNQTVLLVIAHLGWQPYWRMRAIPQHNGAYDRQAGEVELVELAIDANGRIAHVRPWRRERFQPREILLHAEPRVAAHGSATHPPRPPAAPMYGEAGGLRGEITLAERLHEVGYTTQAVGKWHLGENVESQPQNVGFDEFYGFLSVSDMYSEWRDPHFFPEVVYSAARTEWVKNMPFNRCFVHATRGGDVEPVEEVTIPVLSLLDEKWAAHSVDFIRRMGREQKPSAPLPRHPGCPLRQLSARALSRGVAGEASLQGHHPRARRHRGAPGGRPPRDGTAREHAGLRLLRQRPPHGELARRGLHAPFRCAKGSTWEGGVRVPGIFSWPGAIEAGRESDGLFCFTDLLPTVLSLAGAAEKVPSDRFIDGVDQSAFLLAPEGRSARKFVYYWLLNMLSAVRAGEYKFMLASTSDDDTDVAGPGGFTGVTQRYTYAKLFNLYLDPKEQHSYLTRKLAYNDVFLGGIRQHLMSLRPQKAGA